MTHINQQEKQKPTVLCFSGHDPVGGAGIQADIESITAQSVHATTVITALTVQDSTNVDSFTTPETERLIQQAEKVLQDIPAAVFKIGMTGSVEAVQAIHQVITRHPDIPVVLDPVLAAGGGSELGGKPLIKAIRQFLLPYCMLVTPNIHELQQLTGETDIAIAANKILELGTNAVLVTGTHANTDDIRHQLISQDEKHTFANPRLDAEFHGSGCTLTSAIAARLALGENLLTAVRHALDFTYRALQQANALGHGQLIPDRIHPQPDMGASAIRLLKPGAMDERLSGLYAITDEMLMGLYFEPAAEQALKGGARIIQYRNKTTNEKRRLEQAQSLRRLCNKYNSLLIINDDVELALAVNADGVHIGREDTAYEQAREKLGSGKIIGVSCYNDLELARQAELKGADYVAFGAFFSSSIKPEASEAELSLLQQACDELSIPVCCIGGITAGNATPLIEAGSQMLAVISDIFAKSPEGDGIQLAADRLSRLFSA